MSVPAGAGACVDEAACPAPLKRGVDRLAAAVMAAVPGARKMRRRSGCGTEDTHLYWLNTDPCGLVCAAMVYGIVGYGAWAVNTQVLGVWYAEGTGSAALGWLHSILFNTVAGLGLVSHARAMLANPGAVPLHSKPTHPSGWRRMCHKCGTHKPARAHHCSLCGRCVIKMDHHCPWVNNCVGLANQKFFLLFLLYINAMCGYALCLVGAHMWACIAGSAPATLCTDVTAGQGVALLVLCCLALLFGLFTCCMMVDQSNVVLTNETQIDRYHNATGHAPGRTGTEGALAEDAAAAAAAAAAGGGGRQGSGVWANLGEIFGGDPVREGFKLSWLLPTPISYPDPEALTGFCFRDTPKPRSTEEMEALL